MVKLGGKEQKKSKEEKLKEEKILFKEAIAFFSKNTAHIEIVRDNETVKTNFILLPLCHYIPKESKVEFHTNIARDSTHSKISGLLI